MSFNIRSDDTCILWNKSEKTRCLPGLVFRSWFECQHSAWKPSESLSQPVQLHTDTSIASRLATLQNRLSHKCSSSRFSLSVQITTERKIDATPERRGIVGGVLLWSGIGCRCLQSSNSPLSQRNRKCSCCAGSWGRMSCILCRNWSQRREWRKKTFRAMFSYSLAHSSGPGGKWSAKKYPACLCMYSFTH